MSYIGLHILITGGAIGIDMMNHIFATSFKLITAMTG